MKAKKKYVKNYIFILHHDFLMWKRTIYIYIYIYMYICMCVCVYVYVLNLYSSLASCKRKIEKKVASFWDTFYEGLSSL